MAKSKNPAAVALGRLGGRVGGRSTSPAKAAAARANGAKGGRPRKCQHYRPDHNGECLNCDEPASAHQTTKPVTR